MLDNHGDMTGSANCGNGAPMWFQQKAAGDLIGKPLRTEWPFSMVSAIDVKNVPGYSTCGDNETLWALHASDPNYNILNPCCQAMNSPNPPGIGFNSIAQKVCTLRTLATLLTCQKSASNVQAPREPPAAACT